MAIQMRRGQSVDFDPSKMLPGEWAVSIDNEPQKQMVYMCFAPGVVKRMATLEDFSGGSGSTNVETSPYKGKTIVAFGDSIIAGWGWKEGTGIIQPLKEKYPDATWINKAESGANMAVTSSPAHTPIVNQITSYTGAADAIIFDGGVNDLNNNIAMGNISDSYDSNYDTTTICGAMESALQYVMNTFPLAVKLYIIPHSFSKNNYVDSVHEKMIEI